MHGKRAPRSKKPRPVFVCHWQDLVESKAGSYKGSDELQGLYAKFGRRADFSRIGVHIELLKPGRRTSWPHAERDEEEFVFVVRGTVDCWLDGRLYPMRDGDFVGWRGGDGITHVILNNSSEDALLIVGGEASRSRSRVWYPLHPHREKEIGENYWADHPVPDLGPHDGLPDALRSRLPKAALRNAITANRAAIQLKKRKRMRA
ncbi:MAG: cupin domain-containing protein [Alphaproteobacteria bacterium]|nr:cupin domain-containing protein [Alphaproteobacteria bacterium]